MIFILDTITLLCYYYGVRAGDIMYCSVCGAYINEDADICTSCGCETSTSKQKQNLKNLKETESNLKLIFGIILAVSIIAVIIYFS